ncbi:Superinfection immunity protein [Candidatus Electrothrix aarhusensis]|uniref:Superinfection immunity protein n=1 Tax=Candidatus Electrothrix aarhusensis TaxID=1859131 RepID=A0A444IS86_9BACT|nr:Superinfection immunity protein [Candidatus Electrothrix aarhusensis]
MFTIIALIYEKIFIWCEEALLQLPEEDYSGNKFLLLAVRCTVFTVVFLLLLCVVTLLVSVPLMLTAYFLGSILNFFSSVAFQYILQTANSYLPLSKGELKDTVYVGIIFSVIIEIYFFPAIKAAIVKHHNIKSIYIVNFFLGWTYLFWVAALVWVFYKKEEVADVPIKKIDSSTKS